MKRPNDRRRNLVPLGAVTALLAVFACTDADPVAPPEVEVQLAKGGGRDGPKVEAADPSSAPQDITLDVRVIGSGFDEGSTVEFLLDGKSSPKILTNSSTFIDGNHVRANITIAADADVALYDIKVTSSRGKKGIGTEIFGVEKKGGQTGPVYEMSMFGNADASIGDISDTVVVGSVFGEPALFDLDGVVINTLPVPANVTGTWGWKISDGGLFATGNYDAGSNFSPSGRRGLVWDLRSGAPVVTEVEPMAGRPGIILYGINDAGVTAGQAFTSHGDVMPAVWEPDGQPRSGQPLPLLDGSYTKGDALDVNNAGHVAGRNQTDVSGSGHAVMWTLNDDGSADILDLTPAADGTGDNLAGTITEATSGTVKILGLSTIAGVQRATIWTVDVSSQPHTLMGERRAPPEGFFRAEEISGDGDVLGGSYRVWSPDDDVVHELPRSGNNCKRSAQAFDSSGRIFGSSEVSTKKSASCAINGRGVIEVPVIWTKIENLP